MEREDRERGPDTGKIELQRILNFMKENKYHPTDSLYAGDYDGYYKLDFVKEIMYSDQERNYINDRHIKVTIEFDTSYDFKNEYDINGDFDHENGKNKKKAKLFIKNLMNDTYDDDTKSSKKGGRKNRKTKKKTNKL
jgi:hypothetical protein